MPFFTRICKYMAHNKGFRQSYIVLARQYCAETVPTLNIDKRPPKKPRKSSGEVKRLSVADPELQALCAKFPKLFGRRSSRPENIYHVHSEAIDLLTKSITSRVDLEDAVLFEANPGPAILTSRLLESGVPHLRAFEKNPIFLEELEALKHKHPSQLEVLQEDFLRLPTLQACDSYGTTTRVDDLLKGLPQQQWKESPCLVVVASLSRKRELGFLRFLLHVLPQRASLLDRKSVV